MRLLWREEVGRVDPSSLVFVDEMGTHTSLGPLCAYAPIGERAFFEVPRNRGKNTTLLASLDRGGMGPSMAVEGATTSGVFEAYVERVLAPALRPGQVVVMDRLGAHRPRRVRELIEARGCELVYLPSYSPDLNPIEEAFAKVKHLLREISARTKEALIEAMGRALAAVGVEDARGDTSPTAATAPRRSKLLPTLLAVSATGRTARRATSVVAETAPAGPARRRPLPVRRALRRAQPRRRRLCASRMAGPAPPSVSAAAATAPAASAVYRMAAPAPLLPAGRTVAATAPAAPALADRIACPVTPPPLSAAAASVTPSATAAGVEILWRVASGDP